MRDRKEEVTPMRTALFLIMWHESTGNENSAKLCFIVQYTLRLLNVFIWFTTKWGKWYTNKAVGAACINYHKVEKEKGFEPVENHFWI